MPIDVTSQVYAMLILKELQAFTNPTLQLKESQTRLLLGIQTSMFLGKLQSIIYF